MSKSSKKKSDNKKKRKINAFATFMGIIWAVMIAIFMVSFFKIFTYDESYYSKPTYVLSSITAEKYGTLYNRVSDYLSSGLNVDKQSEYKELVYVKRYMDAVGMYRMYKEDGQMDRAEKYYLKMEDALSGMGELSFTKEEIDKLIGIN